VGREPVGWSARAGRRVIAEAPRTVGAGARRLLEVRVSSVRVLKVTRECLVAPGDGRPVNPARPGREQR